MNDGLIFYDFKVRLLEYWIVFSNLYISSISEQLRSSFLIILRKKRIFRPPTQFLKKISRKILLFRLGPISKASWSTRNFQCYPLVPIYPTPVTLSEGCSRIPLKR